MAITILVFTPGPAGAQERSDMRFRGMDQNGDGVITRREWRGNDQSFRVHDWNGDGILSGDEVNPRARPPVRTIDPREENDPNRPFSDWTEARFRELDHNRDNRLTRDEWHFDLESFRRADHNGDQRLTLAEFLGSDIDDDDRYDRFSDIDANGDGRITRDEWHGGTRAFAALDRNGDGILTRREMNLSAVGTSGQMTATSTAYRAGYDRGIADGRVAGREDKANGHGWDLEGQTELERADAGYAERLGPRGDYQEGYRTGFRAGYRAGFGPR
jgi:EF hand domain-containing protein